MPTEAGLATALGTPARRRAGHVQRRGARPGVEQGALAAHVRHPARARLDREADHHVGRAAHAQPDVEPGHAGSWRAGSRGRSCSWAAATPRSPRSRRARSASTPTRPGSPSWPTQVKKATGGRVTKVMIDTSRYRGPGLAPGWDEGDIAGRQHHPDHPADARRRAHRPTQQDGARVPDPAQQAGLAFAKLLGLGRGAVVQGTAPPNAEVLGTVRPRRWPSWSRRCCRSPTTCWPRCSPGRPRSPAAASRRSTARWRPRWPRSPRRASPRRGPRWWTAAGSRRRTGCPPSCWRRWWRRPRRPRRARRHGVPASGAHRAAGGGRRRHARRPLRAGRGLVGGARGRPREDRHAHDGEQPRRRGRRRDQRLLVFAFMSNGALPLRTRPKLDDLAAELSRCGCR